MEREAPELSPESAAWVQWPDLAENGGPAAQAGKIPGIGTKLRMRFTRSVQRRSAG